MFKIYRSWVVFALMIAVAGIASFLAPMALAQEEAPASADEQLAALREELSRSHQNAEDSADGASGASGGGGRTDLRDSGFVLDPYGCYGQTHNPYASGHTNGETVNVAGITRCPVSVNRIGVDVWLFKLNCVLAPFCGWESYGAYGDPTGRKAHRTANNRRYLVGNSAGNPCVNTTYKGRTLSYIIDIDGKLYTAITENIQTVSNCQ